MKILFVAMLLMVGAAVAQPTDILVYHDVYGAYGTAVTTAITNLWPGATVNAYSGGTAGYTSFNSDMASQNWDMIICEMWYYNTDDLDWMMLNDIYDTNIIFVSSWEWENGQSGQMTLANTFGVTATSPISGSVIPHYAWDEMHPICDGITDWGWQDPGLLTLNAQFTVSDAVPVTGWTATSSPGAAGICVANDGQSVISSFTPAYANESVAIWENILEFMWGGAGALEQSTWGAIKANF